MREKPPAHVLPDCLADGLTAVFVGTAAGDRSAARGHYYAGPGNEFWRFLADSRLTPELLGPERDAEMVAFGFGLTDIAKHRSSSTDAALCPSDFDIPAFVAKIARYRPAWVAFTSKAAAVEVARALGFGRTVSLGAQLWSIAGAKVFVLPSSSGANRSPLVLEGKATRQEWFSDLRRAVAASRQPLSGERERNGSSEER